MKLRGFHRKGRTPGNTTSTQLEDFAGELAHAYEVL
jgi:hypothetical protein